MQFNTSQNTASTVAPPFAAATAHIRLDIEWLRSVGADLSPSAFKVFAALLSRLGTNETVWASQRTIAADAGVSFATAKRMLFVLKKSGLISWKNPGRKDGGTSVNHYSFSRELCPWLKLSHKITTEPKGSIEAPSAPEPLSAADAEQLRCLGLTGKQLSLYARKRAAACRHALQFIEANPKWWAKRRDKAASIVPIILNPERYPLEQQTPLTTAAREFIHAMPRDLHDDLTRWARTDAMFPAMLSIWGTLDCQKRAVVAEQAQSKQVPLFYLLQEAAAVH